MALQKRVFSIALVSIFVAAGTAAGAECTIGSSDAVVLCGGGAGNNCQVNVTNQQQNFDLSNLYNLPKRPEAAWYTPDDNLGDLAAFSHVDVFVDQGDITLRAKADRAALLRIRVYWCK